MLRDGRSNFQDYIEQYPKYNQYVNNSIAKEIFYLMSELKNINQMILASDQDKPALEMCIVQIEDKYSEQKLFDLSDDFTKQALGAMVKTILEPFGYEPIKQKRISKNTSRFLSSASVYKFNHSKQRVKIIPSFTIEKI